MTMKIVMMKRQGSTWQVHLADDQGENLQAYIYPRQGGEDLASAAVRLEDLLRNLQQGNVKPLNAAL